MNLSDYNIDFSDNLNLSEEEKLNLKDIQENYRPMERVDLLLDFRNNGKISEDEFETLTGIPYVG